MDGQLEPAALDVIFHPPRSDGRFEGEQAAYLAEISKRRPSIVLTFAPKAAGTYLRTAAIIAADGQIVRTVHAQGGRDAQFYLPTFLAYYRGGVTPYTLVTHVHMQALPANRYLIDALSLKPIIMLRSVPDMLASFLDMLVNDENARIEGLNCTIPADFTQMNHEARADYVIDMVAPWYASYFATWRDYVESDPHRTHVARYRDFLEKPGKVLQHLLEHAGVPQSRKQCEDALKIAWADRSTLRYNKGVAGRGAEYFTKEQRERITRLLSRFKSLDPWMNDIL